MNALGKRSSRFIDSDLSIRFIVRDGKVAHCENHDNHCPKSTSRAFNYEMKFTFWFDNENYLYI